MNLFFPFKIHHVHGVGTKTQHLKPKATMKSEKHATSLRYKMTTHFSGVHVYGTLVVMKGT